MEKDDSYKYLIIGCVIILFGFFIWSIRPFLKPVIVAASILVFLIPIRKNPVARSVMIIVSVIFIAWIIYLVRDVLFPFVVALSLAYLFDPLIDKFEDKKIPRTGGILIVLVIIVGIIYFSSIVIIPEISAELAVLIESFPTYEEIEAWIEKDLFQFLFKFGFTEERLKQLYSDDLPKRIHDFTNQTVNNLTHVTSAISTFANQLLYIALIPFITFYFLRDFNKMTQKAKSLIPTKYSKKVLGFIALMNDLTHRYFRGKFTISVILAIVATGILYAFRLKFALIIGLSTGLLSFIPYVGPIISFVIGISLGLLNENPVQAIIIITSVIAVLQVLDMVFISPKVIGSKLGIEPVTLILSILVFAKLLGVVGLIISVPFVAVIKATAVHFYEDWSKKHHLYDES